jgi:hypothetical protein
MDCDDKFAHSCPEQGHGVCPICFDTQFNLNEKIIALDSK